MKIFLAGGTGFVGTRVLEALCDEGHRVTCLARNGKRDALPEGAETLEGDALKPETYADRITGHDAVVNLIGIIRAFPARGITFRRMHVEATVNLVDAAKRGGVRRFLQMSANGVEAGATPYQTTKKEAEEYLKASGLDWTIFRPSLIFGQPPPGKIEFCTQMAGLVGNAPLLPVFGDGNYRLQPVHVRDVATAFARALETAEAVGRTFHLGGDDVFTYREILDIICAGMGKNAKPKLPLPWRLLRPIVAVLGRFAFFPATADQIEMLLQGNCVPESDYKAMLDIAPTPFTADAIAYLREGK